MSGGNCFREIFDGEETIFLEGNFPRGQLSGGQFSGNQSSRRQLSGRQFSSGAIILGGSFPGGNYPGGNHPGGNYPGAIVLEDNCPRTVRKPSLVRVKDQVKLKHQLRSIKLNYL